MSTPNSDRRDTFIRAVLFIVIVLIAIGLIGFLKRSTDVPLTPEHAARRDSLSRMAKPDTTFTPDEDTSIQTSPYPTTTDSVSMDLRVPSDAGYQDGYYAGLQDGISGDERASYDETSQFPTPAQRRNYAEAYRRGYLQGFADGQEGREYDHDHDHDHDDEAHSHPHKHSQAD